MGLEGRWGEGWGGGARMQNGRCNYEMTFISDT